MDKRKARIKIGNLLDQCEECPNSLQKKKHREVCVGCVVYEQLNILRPFIDGNEAKQKVSERESYLAKGPDMSKSELKWLLEEKVPPLQIYRALQVDKKEYYELLTMYGFTRFIPKKQPKEEKKKMVATSLELSMEEYVEFNSQGLKDIEIAKLKGVNKQQIANWKFARREQLKDVLKKKKEIDVGMEEVNSDEPEVLPSIEETSIGYLPEVPESKDPDENTGESYKELESEFKAVVKKAGDAEAEYKSQLYTLKQQLSELNILKHQFDDLAAVHAACADVESELHELRIEHSHLVIEHHQLVDDYQELVTERTTLSYDLENTRDQLSVFDADNQFLADENKKLKEMLMQLWMRR